MKKFLPLLLICLSLNLVSNAQSFELMKKDGYALVDGSINISTTNDSTTIEVPVYVKNISNKVKEVLVNVYVKSMVDGSAASYCWGASCFDIATSTSTSFTTIEALDTAKEFHSDYNPKRYPGVTEIMYTFYNRNNSDDSISFTVNYEIVVTSIDYISELKESIRAYPNPVQNFLNVEYKLQDYQNANISLFDIVGKRLQTQEIYNNSNTVQLDFSDLKSGLYIWTFEVDGIPIKTEKIIKR
ncbi:MAG: hypothetical protein C0597_03280 [Marinilabiliales bacterium]|nr:MAG: hypothetical protein C0597_03280 [Marinilabiliales bacterium]